VADTQRLQHHGSWAVVSLAGLTLGLALAGPASAAEPPTTSSSSSTSTSTSTTSSSTTSTSTSTTTSTTLAPPPTTTPPVTSTLIPPLVDSGEPAQVGEAAQIQRDRDRGTLPRTGPRTTASGPTLPFTGNGTLAVFAAGLGALAIGALALWWGSRNRPEVDARGPEATG
jgi:hypothetical protein